jgi:uncharacterized protein YxjI
LGCIWVQEILNMPLEVIQPAVATEGSNTNWAQQAAADAYVKLAAQPAQSQSDASNLPDSFKVKEHFFRSLFGMPEKFDIEGADGKDYGTITGKWIALTPSFKMEDNHGQNMGRARQELFSWGVKDDFYDGQDRMIGSVHEQVFRSMFGLGIFNRYSVLDGSGNRVGESDKVEALSTDLIIKGNDGQPIARLHRGMFNLFGDTWNVDVYKPGAIDKRELALMAAFKTHADNVKQREAQAESESKSDDEDSTDK